MPVTYNQGLPVIQLDSDVAIPEKAALNVTAVRVKSIDESSCNSNLTAKTATNPFDTDIEALNSHSSIDKPRKSMAIESRTDCQVWPGKDHWKKQAKEAKMKRSCSCLARLNRRNRIIAKIVLIALVVGIAVSVGFGISKPLGAPIWGKRPSDN